MSRNLKLCCRKAHYLSSTMFKVPGDCPLLPKSVSYKATSYKLQCYYRCPFPDRVIIQSGRCIMPRDCKTQRQHGVNVSDEVLVQLLSCTRTSKPSSISLLTSHSLEASSRMDFQRYRRFGNIKTCSAWKDDSAQPDRLFPYSWRSKGPHVGFPLN